MNVADLYVNIVLKGGDTANKQLVNVKTGLSEVRDMSIGAKAAILAVLYGLERMMASSANTGNSLEQFTLQTGIATDVLERYQWMLRESGGNAEQAAGAFTNLQKIMFEWSKGGQLPAGFQQFNAIMGGKFDLNKMQSNTEYAMGKLREYAHLEKNLTARNYVLGSFGVGEMAVGLSSKFDPANAPNSQLHTKAQIENLSRVKVGWENINKLISMAMDKFVGKHGLEITHDLEILIPKVLELAEAFTKLAEALHIFEVIGWILDKAGIQANIISKYLHGDFSDLIAAFKEMPAVAKSRLDSVMTDPSYAMSGQKTVNNHNNTNVVVHGAKVETPDHIASHIKKEVKKVYYQNKAVTEVN